MATQKSIVKKIGELPIERIGPGESERNHIRAMKLVANASKNHFLKGFRQDGKQTDESQEGWESRKSGRGGSRGILVLSGDLSRDVTVLEVTSDTIIIGTSRIVYAARHNEGLDDMPQREFIGPSKVLEQVNGDIIVKIMGKPLRP